MRAVLAVSLLVLLSCASSPPQPTAYLLRFAATDSDAAAPNEPSVVLGDVEVADYLEQRGLAIEVAPNELRPARSHVWAEPLGEGLPIFLRAAIASALGEDVGFAARGLSDWKQRVDVFVEQLHGTMSGRALLVASFRITPAEASGKPSDFRFSRSAPLEREGYAALVEAEMELAKQLAAAIAASIRSLP